MVLSRLPEASVLAMASVALAVVGDVVAAVPDDAAGGSASEGAVLAATLSMDVAA
jgi:hypothetical protein